jgi:Tol biopolymer transport system component
LPLTSSPGIERNVAFSPDGKHVAYVWSGENNDNLEVYVKIIGAGDPLKLTNSPGIKMSPVWSPDGRYVAYLGGLRESAGIYIVPEFGGVERKLTDVFRRSGPGAQPQALDWSPDGKTIAIVDKTSEDEPWKIAMVSVDTGERHVLTNPPTGYSGDGLVSFSPDGSRLAFIRSQNFTGDIYTVNISGGEPVRATSDQVVIHGLAWSSDGANIVFSSERGGGDSTLWKVPAAGGTPMPVAGIGENVFDISVSRQGDRLAYAERSSDLNIYRLELTSGSGGRRRAGTTASFISSTRLERGPQFSPDGSRVVFTSNRSGALEVWECDTEGKSLVQLTNSGNYSASPRWSTDGRFIAFSSLTDGNADIYVVAARGGSPRRLTDDPSGEVTPSWSKDGRWIYFSSTRTGRSEVWKIPVDGGPEIQLTRNGGLNPIEAADGSAVYFVKGAPVPGIWQVNTDGGEETRVLESAVRPGNWAVTSRGIYLLTDLPGPSPYTLSFFDLAMRQMTAITTLDGPRVAFQLSDLTVSPDEHWVLYAQRDKLEFDLKLVENFH